MSFALRSLARERAVALALASTIIVLLFAVWWVALFYVVAMACLCLHLDHGVWSMLQTLGWNDARSTPLLRAVSRGVALVVFLGFISVPVAVLAGGVR